MLKTNARLRVVTIALLFCVLGFQIPAPANWQKPLQPSPSGGALTCLALHPTDPTKLLVASGHDIFEGDRLNAWQPLWSQTDSNASIKKLLSFGIIPERIFALTDQSVFMGSLKDRSWHKVYRDNSKTPLSFAVHPKDPNHWYLGTQKGLWETLDSGKTWAPVQTGNIVYKADRVHGLHFTAWRAAYAVESDGPNGPEASIHQQLEAGMF